MTAASEKRQRIAQAVATQYDEFVVEDRRVVIYRTERGDEERARRRADALRSGHRTGQPLSPKPGKCYK